MPTILARPTFQLPFSVRDLGGHPEAVRPWGHPSRVPTGSISWTFTHVPHFAEKLGAQTSASYTFALHANTI
jgi:hypothetical protein